MSARIERDRDGHLADAGTWSTTLAHALAAEAGVTLTPQHLAVLRTVRDFHAETGVSPSMRPLVRLLRERLGGEVGTSIAVMRLFPTRSPGGPARSVALVAGLPCPDGCR